MQSFVECYTGLMGGGKSFSAVQRMNKHIAQGGVVYSNILLKVEPWYNYDYPMKEFPIPVCPLLQKVGFIPECKLEWREQKRVPVVVKDKEGRPCFLYNSHGAAFLLERFHNWKYQEGQFNYINDDDVNVDLPNKLPTGTVDRAVLVVLDEALDHFEAGDGNTNAQFRSFLRHVRKLGINLIFIAQDFGSMEKKIRVLVHYVWTFRDLKTWRVPVIGALLPGGVLPLPWSDNIQQRQYHQKQYGMAKAETINKGLYAYRDPLIFQCYQSVSLHNSNITMNGKAPDFGSSGRIIRKGKKVSKIERILIYVLLSVALWFAFKKPVPVAPVAPVPVAPVVENKEVIPDGLKRNALGQAVEFLPLSWQSVGSDTRVYLEGSPVRAGMMTSRGMVVSAGRDFIEFQDFDGVRRFVYHKPAISGSPTDSKDIAKGNASPKNGKSS